MNYTVRPFTASRAPQFDLAEFERWLTLAPNRPLDLEIGCGVGWHPIQYAQANPDRRLIAIEHTRDKFARFRSRLDRHADLKNLFAVHGNALAWVPRALGPSSLDRCFLLYPNPEPKAANKRWLRSPFMQCLLATLKVGGELWLATNEKRYFDEALEWAEKAWGLSLIETRLLDATHLPNSRTHFEKKYLTRGETCFDVRWRKVRD